MRKSLVLLILQVFVFSAFIFSQDQPKSVLFDEMQFLGCDDLDSRVDSFANYIKSSPNSVGFVVIYGKKDFPRANLNYEDWITSGLKYARGLSSDQFTIVRGKLQEKGKIQFWLIPEGAKSPEFDSEKWNFTLPRNTRPFVFTGTEKEAEYCPSTEGSGLKHLIEYLYDNPGSRTNIVINERIVARFNEEKTKISALLVDKYAVNPKRIRFFFVPDSKHKNDDYYYPRVEVWLLP